MKSHPRIIDRILEGIGRSRTFCVAGHIRPDGDCIGSQLGLALALRDQGKRVVCWNEDHVPQNSRFSTRTNCFNPRRPASGSIA